MSRRPALVAESSFGIGNHEAPLLEGQSLAAELFVLPVVLSIVALLLSYAARLDLRFCSDAEVWFRNLPLPKAKAQVDEPLRASLTPAVSKWTPAPVVEPVALPVPEPADVDDVEEPQIIEELAETKLVQGKEYTGTSHGSNVFKWLALVNSWSGSRSWICQGGRSWWKRSAWPGSSVCLASLVCRTWRDWASGTLWVEFSGCRLSLSSLKPSVRS